MALYPESTIQHHPQNQANNELHFDFLTLAERTLNHIEQVCDSINDSGIVDIDNQRVGAMLTLTFANQNQIVINLQKPLAEIWMATSDGGYHYRWVGVSWLDTKSHDDLFVTLSLAASKQCQTSIVFTALPAQ